MKRLIVITLTQVIIGLISCSSQTKDLDNLDKVLERIRQIETASYYSTNFFCFSGDTIPIDEKTFEYFNEYTVPADTSVGAYYVKFELSDTTKMIFAYDGKMRARINWKENNFETDDFSKNPWPYRAVIAPFFAKSKALIEYALTTKDSIKIDSVFYKNSVAYKISIFNERVELVGRLPIHISELGSNEGVVSEYILWINRKTNLPYKFQRTLPANTMIEEISNLKINNLNRNNFAISNYIPVDMPTRTEADNKPKIDLINSIAFNYQLNDLENQSHSLKDISSKVYMINLTSMFCGPCGLSVEFLNDLSKKYSKEDFSFVSLYNENEKKELLNYIKQHEIKYEVLLADKTTLDSYNLHLTPTFLILDNNKRISKIIYGYKKGETEIEIENAIKTLL